jgi:ketosteroid isomerase-like protein
MLVRHRFIPRTVCLWHRIISRPSAGRQCKAITLKVKFTIVELVVMSPQWSFARTNSAGIQMINDTGATSAEGNQELFIFKKDEDGKWRIARYSFSTTNPL